MAGKYKIICNSFGSGDYRPGLKFSNQFGHICDSYQGITGTYTKMPGHTIRGHLMIVLLEAVKHS